MTEGKACMVSVDSKCENDESRNFKNTFSNRGKKEKCSLKMLCFKEDGLS